MRWLDTIKEGTGLRSKDLTGLRSKDLREAVQDRKNGVRKKKKKHGIEYGQM
jgi:hypothetical protein